MMSVIFMPRFVISWSCSSPVYIIRHALYFMQALLIRGQNPLGVMHPRPQLFKIMDPVNTSAIYFSFDKRRTLEL